MVMLTVSTPQGTQTLKVSLEILYIVLNTLRAQPEDEIWSIHLYEPPTPQAHTVIVYQRVDHEWEGRLFHQPAHAF